MTRKKTMIADIERGLHERKDPFTYTYKTEEGLTEEIVRAISAHKDEPQWMLDFRLRALETYRRLDLPPWGPDLSDLDLNEIITYVRPETNLQQTWEDIPAQIKETFTRLGIPQAEHEFLAGVAAQYDSEMIYRSIQESAAKEGVIYMDMESALRQHEDIVKKYFMSLVPAQDNIFAAFHGAVWSGGTFIYVPAGAHVQEPLQTYYRLNAPGAGQFEHTLIIVEEGAYLHYIEGCSAPRYSVNNLHAGVVELFVKEGATLRFSTIENWSTNMYNLSTKRAVVEKDGSIEWISGSFGSKISYIYPMSILKGERARADFVGLTFANAGQNLDTGAKVIHAAPYTTSNINSKSISKDGGIAVYRGMVKVQKNAPHSKSTVDCESLMLDNKSVADTIPTIQVDTDEVDLGHEAKIGRISDEAIFYLMSRGVSEEEAKAIIVRGFVEPVSKELPLQYADEMNRLIALELEGTIG